MRAAILLGLLLLPWTLRSEDTVDESLLKAFEARVYRDRSGSSIPYRLFKPDGYDSKQKYPLILFLHGAVGLGSDNRLQFNGGNEVPPKALIAPDVQAKYPAFILAPQCPHNDSWSHSGSAQPSQPMRLSLAAVAALEKEFSIDGDRLYVIGLSMGGHGVWDLISRKPAMFAAAVPICSAGNPASAKLLVNLPIWCFHGDADPLVSVKYAREMMAALQKAGGHPKYSEYPGVGHNSYVNAFKEPELLPWLFGQRRNADHGSSAFSK